jgi:Lar family restriction alleviation protein
MPQLTNTSDAEELLACPFCGGTQITATCNDQRDDAHWFFAMCDKCGAEGPGQLRTTPSDSRDEEAFAEHGRQCALLQWNRRPTPTVPVEDAELVERLNQRLERYAADDKLTGSTYPLGEFEISDVRQVAARLTALSARNAVVEEDRKALAEIVARCGLCSAVAVDCGLLTTKETDDGE